jgi:hypothetical protein
VDADTAIWLGELLGKAVVEMEHSPGLIIEAEGRTGDWVQIIPEESEHDGTLAGFVVNFPYRGHAGSPLETLQTQGVKPPPGTQTRTWEDGGYATLWIRPDVPLVGLAHFAGDILEKLIGVPADSELTAQFEYGY